MTFYSDSTPPDAYSGSLQTAIGAIATDGDPRIEFALYEDSSTWSDWKDWAD